MSKSKKKTEAAKDESMELTKNDPNGPEDKKCLPPSCSGSSISSPGSDFRGGVDHGTIKMMALIAELHIMDPETYKSLKFDPANETLLSFSKKCATHISPEKKKAIIEDMKS